MLFDELLEQIKALQPDIEVIRTYWAHARFEDEFHDLEQQTQKEDFWQRTDQAQVLKRLTQLRTVREQYQHIMSSYQDVSQMLELFKDNEISYNSMSTMPSYMEIFMKKCI